MASILVLIKSSNFLQIKAFNLSLNLALRFSIEYNKFLLNKIITLMYLKELSIAPNTRISFFKSSLSPGVKIIDLILDDFYINSSIKSIFSFISLRVTKSIFITKV